MLVDLFSRLRFNFMNFVIAEINDGTNDPFSLYQLNPTMFEETPDVKRLYLQTQKPTIDMEYYGIEGSYSYSKESPRFLIGQGITLHAIGSDKITLLARKIEEAVLLCGGKIALRSFLSP
jgi:hypothetical protein